MLYGILDRVVDDYAPVIAELRRDIDQIESEVFGGDPDVSQRIYRLSREVIEFQRATDPLRAMLRTLLARDRGARPTPRSSACTATCATSPTTSSRRWRPPTGTGQLLERLLTVNASLVGQRQNEEMRRLSETSLARARRSSASPAGRRSCSPRR